MAGSVQRAAQGTEGNTLPARSRMAKADIAVQGSSGKNAETRPGFVSFRPLVGELLRRPNYTRKGFVDAAIISEGNLADALVSRDRKSFDIDWLAAQDNAFLIDFIDLVIEARQLTPESKRLTRASILAELTRQLQLTGERRDDAREGR